jgi:hypothetical protein
MSKYYILASICSVLFLGTVTLLVFNITNPKLFRYFTVKCKVDYHRVDSCGVGCEQYTYYLVYDNIHGYYKFNCYNNVNCQLPSEILCEIIQPKYNNPYLMYASSNDNFTPSNILNVVLILIFAFIFLSCFIYSVCHILITKSPHV